MIGMAAGFRVEFAHLTFVLKMDNAFAANLGAIPTAFHQFRDGQSWSTVACGLCDEGLKHQSRKYNFDHITDETRFKFVDISFVATLNRRLIIEAKALNSHTVYVDSGIDFDESM
ncbi:MULTISPECIES: hypothetical protein [Agrobacterium]|uniref:Uncharacterized protein n=5 Tax=Rhizobium/Agrobacterium group TaxID=227290 RepID=A0A5B9T9A6_AGRTU|nr:hypothetical protein RP75_24445 [Agrobacterium arsenijevicii]QEG97921.1 hypothetical protein AgrTiKerr27_00191 [Agrobacterium tumefaciens]